jgi:rhodanese-related sulfurtransferase
MRVLIIIAIALTCLLAAILIKRKKEARELESHSITPEALHALLSSKQDLLLVDVRQPLDLLGHSEIIPGATRISPKEVLQNPSLIPRDQDAVVYCTCLGEKTSRLVLNRALALNFSRVKLLKGGLSAWKAKGYPVVTYDQPFHLDVRT